MLAAFELLRPSYSGRMQICWMIFCDHPLSSLQILFQTTLRLADRAGFPPAISEVEAPVPVTNTAYGP